MVKAHAFQLREVCRKTARTEQGSAAGTGRTAGVGLATTRVRAAAPSWAVHLDARGQLATLRLNEGMYCKPAGPDSASRGDT